MGEDASKEFGERGTHQVRSPLSKNPLVRASAGRESSVVQRLRFMFGLVITFGLLIVILATYGDDMP